MTKSLAVLKYVWLAIACKEFHRNNAGKNGLVYAYPSGAGGCAGGGPAVGRPHLDSSEQEITNTSFDEKNVTVSIGGIIIPKGGTADVVATIATDILVTGINMKGSLFRLSAPDGYNTRDMITPAFGTRSAANVCRAPVVGITHFNRYYKSVMSGTLDFPYAIEGIVLDLTIVWENSDEVSTYGTDSI
jgi:hypothetical protein